MITALLYGKRPTINTLPELSSSGNRYPSYDTGTIEIYKTDPNGVPLAGAKFEATNIASGEKFPIGPTDGNGYTVSADETPIPFGTYTIVETVKPEGFTDDGKTWTVVIDETAPNGVVRKDIKNRPNTGTVVFHKETNTGANLSGWEIKLYSDAACTKLVGTYTTGANGTVSDTLLEGTYYAKETAVDDAYWACDTTVKTVTVQAKQTTDITFTNTHYGKIQITKNTNTGVDLAGWEFKIYADRELTNLVGTYVTDENGIIVTENLAPATYYVKETEIDDPYWSYNTGAKSIRVVAGRIANVTVTNTHNGKIKYHKETNTGADLGGWEIKLYSDAELTDLVGTYTISGAGYFTTSRLLPGTYYAVETASQDAFWVCDTEVKTIIVVAGQTTDVVFTNTHYGKIQFNKETNTGVDLDGWEIKLYGDAELTNLVGTYITGEDGTVITENLLPGTYYAAETASGSQYWVSDAEVKTIAVTAGKIANTTFTNTHHGKIQFNKETNTGADLGGWEIKLYGDSELTNLVGTYITGEDGTVITENLLPGTYYAAETASGSQYWVSDAEVKTITVTTDQTASVTFNNTHYGKIQFNKETNTGADLGGWEIKLYSDAELTNLIGTYITGEDGTIVTEILLPGTYYAVEIASPSQYWICDAEVKTITVAAGQTTEAVFTNTHYGKIHFVVHTNTGADLSGWEIKLYSDAELTDLVAIITNENGIVGTYIAGEDGTADTEILLPGTYYAQQTATQDPLWSCDTEVKTAIVVAGQTTEIVFNNIHYGNIHFNKTTNTGTDLSGWEIKLYGDAELTDLIGTYITGEDGTVITENLLPGTYYAVETPSELIYWSSDAETKEIVVTAGSTQEVNFHNDLLTATVTIDKVSPEKRTPEGALFALRDRLPTAAFPSG